MYLSSSYKEKVTIKNKRTNPNTYKENFIKDFFKLSPALNLIF